MPVHRFFASFRSNDKMIVLDDPDEFAHLARVLRLVKGDALELVNGQGDLAGAVVEDIGRSSAKIRIMTVTSVPASDGLKFTLACAMPKRSKFETIIEKCTELGVDRIVPLITDRSDVVLDNDRAWRKVERFNRVVINASKQSKRLWFPEIVSPMPFDRALAMLPGPGKALFIPWLEGQRVPLAKAFKGVGDAREVVFFIGPEGDFTPDEVALAIKAGAVGVSLGEHVLKVETAAMAVSAFVLLSGRG